MSEAQTTQTAVDTTNAAAKPAAEVSTDARTNGDDLDTLLSEFETSKPQPSPAPAKPEPKAAPATDDLKVLADEVRGLRTEREREVFRRDMDATIKDVRGDLNPEYFDNEFVESWMDARARQDPRLATAWTNRHANPQAFAKVKEQLGRELAKKFSKLPDKQATDDRDAVTAAVRGASRQAPEGQAPNYGRMSNNEFAAEKAKLFG